MLMTLPTLCTSLEFAKRLKELGVPQTSYFGWCCPESELRPCLMTLDGAMQAANRGMYFAAPTAGELGEWMPNGSSSWKNPFINDGLGVWKAGCEEDRKVHYADTEADARAKMLIHLIEQGLIQASELK